MEAPTFSAFSSRLALFTQYLAVNCRAIVGSPFGTRLARTLAPPVKGLLKYFSIVEKRAEQIGGGVGDAVVGAVVVGTAFQGVGGAGHFSGPQLAAFLFQLLHFVGARGVHATGADEFHDAAQFILVEPRAVRFADIHDDARAMSEGDAVHESLANGTWNVTDWLHFARVGG